MRDTRFEDLLSIVPEAERSSIPPLAESPESEPPALEQVEKEEKPDEPVESENSPEPFEQEKVFEPEQAVITGPQVVEPEPVVETEMVNN